MASVADACSRAVAFAVMLALAAVLCESAHARRSVLLVFDEDNDLPGLAVINRSLRQVFRGEFRDDVEFYSESLNVSQFRDAGYEEALREHFGRKYQGRRPDLIVAVMEPSLDFLIRHADALFPGVPIVFCGLDSSYVGRWTRRENVTGVLVERDFAPTLDIALRLQPQARNVFVVGGTSRFDRQLQAIARRQFQPFESRVAITWLTALPMDELLKKVSDLPPQSVLFYLTVFTDGAGGAFVPHEVLPRIADAANAPVYVGVDQFVGLGAVGGNVYSLGTHGQHAARIGVRILRGEAPASIPVIAPGAQSNVFDWRQLQRWGLDERRLPPGSVVEFRAPSLWGAYRWYFLGGFGLLLLQTALVVALLMSERRRARAEGEARRQRDELAHAQRVGTLGELTASIAHELNQPLTAIVANARAARRLLAVDRADPEVEEALDDMAREASRAGETIHRLHALFRKEPGARVPIEVNALIEDVLRLLGPDLRRRDIAVDFARAEALPPVLGDGVQLRQVFINLLVNAEEAIARPGDAPRKIGVKTDRADATHVMVSIRDSGTGVEDSELERIFERFFSSKPQGLGMGLAISRSIVEAHGGRIWATRNEDRGLTLHVRLPAQPATASRARGAPSPSESVG